MARYNGIFLIFRLFFDAQIGFLANADVRVLLTLFTINLKAVA